MNTSHWLGEETSNIFIFDKQNKLRRKLWIYPNGAVNVREWDEDGNEITFGEKPLMKEICGSNRTPERTGE